ncbi:hypothetical protein HRbin24_00009 [bacterium HR24]|nr:hypothetical protein HRbin24_00009 [bacterium HR24]
MAYWIVVGSEENFRIAQERGFDIFGFNGDVTSAPLWSGRWLRPGVAC